MMSVRLRSVSVYTYSQMLKLGNGSYDYISVEKDVYGVKCTDDNHTVQWVLTNIFT